MNILFAKKQGIFYTLCLPSFLLNLIPAASLQTTPTIRETVWDVLIDEFGNINPWVLLQPGNLSINRYFAFIDLASNETFLETLSPKALPIIAFFVGKTWF